MILDCFSGYSQKSLEQLLKKYNTHDVPYISVEELEQSIDKAVVLDSREYDEYNVSHISGAIPVGYNHFDISKVTSKKLPEDTLIVVYCSLGIRSEVVARKLKRKGYTNVKNLYGGIFEWKNNNLKVEDSLNRITERVHIFSKPWGKWLKEGEKYTPYSKK